LSRRSFSEGGLLECADLCSLISIFQLNKSFIFSINPGDVGLFSTAIVSASFETSSRYAMLIFLGIEK
jgi:hypothetical protein